MGKMGLGLVGLILALGCSDQAGRTEPQTATVRYPAVVDNRATEILDQISWYVSTHLNEPGLVCLDKAFMSYAALYTSTDQVAVAKANEWLVSLDNAIDMPDSPTVLDTEMPCLFALPLLVRTYAHPDTQARLVNDAKTALRAIMWRFVRARSKVADATLGTPEEDCENVDESCDVVDTWTLKESENIDAILKSSYLLATNALRNTQYDVNCQDPVYTPSNPCPYEMGDKKSLLDHQVAWRNYWKEYFRQRAREGILSEYASPIYSKHVLPPFYNVRDLGGSASVRNQAEQFLTLYWADVAQDFQPTTGVRGGAMSRSSINHYGQTGAAQNGLRAWTYLYGWHNPEESPLQKAVADWPSELTNYTTLFPATSNYRIPDVVNAVATDAEKSAFAYVSCRPGYLEKDNTADQYGEDYHVGFYPGGSSLQRRYTFNTSDYVFGTLKVVPRANMDASGYQNSSNRWMGVTFASSPDARIAVFGRGTSGGRGYAEIIGDAKHNAMVVARDPSASQSDATLIFVSKSVWDTNVGQGDWLFFRSGNGYAAIRVASSAPSLPSYDVTDTPELLGKFLTLREMWSPIVIQMGQASEPHYNRSANLDSFEEFRQSVTSNYFNYANGVLTYRSEVCDTGLSSACEEYVIRSGATYVTNIAGYPLPTVNGGGSVSPAKTYSSPFINGEHGKDTVVLSHEDHAAKELNFAWQ